MVLQREPKRNLIWGYGKAGAEIELYDGWTTYVTNVDGNYIFSTSSPNLKHNIKN